MNALSCTATNSSAYEDDMSPDTVSVDNIDCSSDDLSPVIKSRFNEITCQSKNVDALSFSSHVEVFDPYKPRLSFRSKLRDILLKSENIADLQVIKAHIVKLCLQCITHNSKQSKTMGHLNVRS